jgi:phenylacetate-CoA ligase
MTATTISGPGLLRARMAAALGGQLPGHIERLGWPPQQLAEFQRDRLRALLARAIKGSPFHAERLRDVHPGRFELADLRWLPVMTKAQMMDDFDRVVTDRRLTREVVEQHLAGSVTEPSLLFGEYVCLLSGGSSGRRGLIIQGVGEYADFAASILRRAVAAALASGGLPPGGAW